MRRERLRSIEANGSIALDCQILLSTGSCMVPTGRASCGSGRLAAPARESPLQQIRAWFTNLLSWIDLTITAAIMLSWYGTMAGLAAVMSSSTAGESGWFAVSGAERVAVRGRRR